MTEEDDEPPSRRGPLIAFVLILVLILGGAFISQILTGVSRIQDCVMSGRSNCVLFH